jgi:hypothetical protein
MRWPTTLSAILLEELSSRAKLLYRGYQGLTNATCGIVIEKPR